MSEFNGLSDGNSVIHLKKSECRYNHRFDDFAAFIRQIFFEKVKGAMATVDLKNSNEPRIREEIHENTICRMYNNELGEHIVVTSDNEEKISREISGLEDSGMPKQWFLQK